jgi:methanogenic corrinoid protein MtbC1
MRDATQQQEQQGRSDRSDIDNSPLSLAGALTRKTAKRAVPAKPHIYDSITDELHRQTVIRPWSGLLERTIATDILPRMLARRPDSVAPAAETAPPSRTEVVRFVDLIIAENITAAMIMIARFIERGATRDGILHDLFTPAARRLGDLWDEDVADFTVVTVAMIRLNQILRDTAVPVSEAALLRGHERHLLIAAAPGEQHSFGVSVLSDLFRRAGWVVQAEPVLSRAGLMTLVRRNWFDVVGLSVSAEDGLKGLPAVIRALRRTAMNTGLGVMVGGKAFVDHPERAQFVGADATASDGQSALFEADTMVERAHAALR